MINTLLRSITTKGKSCLCCHPSRRRTDSLALLIQRATQLGGIGFQLGATSYINNLVDTSHGISSTRNRSTLSRRPPMSSFLIRPATSPPRPRPVWWSAGPRWHEDDASSNAGLTPTTCLPVWPSGDASTLLSVITPCAMQHRWPLLLWRWFTLMLPYLLQPSTVF
jgi:hypothetical protein